MIPVLTLMLTTGEDEQGGRVRALVDVGRVRVRV